jgi:5-amino-6-(5-phosphoribosylamino)uracil reductase/diaminohydroxyphosphoribosylaminopyrimidine deaminase/5-amino-6-(5-phosphoribosylamino)uracil reductase
MTPLPSRPLVALHFAQSLDGRIALSGKKTPLSSAAGVELAHRARAAHDAVLVGSGTVRIDDPRLTVRAFVGRQPKRVVLASALDVPTSARVFLPGPGTLVVGVEGKASEAARARLTAAGVGVRLVPPGQDGLVSLSAALSALRAWGVERLLVEGGARILTAFLRERLANEATIEIAPRLLGAQALPALGLLDVDAVERSFALVERTVEEAGTSIVVRGQIAYA